MKAFADIFRGESSRDVSKGRVAMAVQSGLMQKNPYVYMNEVIELTKAYGDQGDVQDFLLQTVDTIVSGAGLRAGRDVIEKIAGAAWEKAYDPFNEGFRRFAHTTAGKWFDLMNSQIAEGWEYREVARVVLLVARNSATGSYLQDNAFKVLGQTVVPREGMSHVISPYATCFSLPGPLPG